MTSNEVWNKAREIAKFIEEKYGYKTLSVYSNLDWDNGVAISVVGHGEIHILEDLTIVNETKLEL